MSKGFTGGKVVIEEETEDDKGQVTNKLNKSVKSIDIESRIVVEEDFFEDEDETSNMSMAVDDVDTKQKSGHLDNTNNHEKNRGTTINFDESGSEALDLSFIPCSIPLKKRKISVLPNNNTQNEERVKPDYHHHHAHRQQQQLNQKIVEDLLTTIPATSAFNQLTNNRLNSFSLQSKHNHFPFTLRATPSATSSSCSSSNNCKPLSLVKNHQEHPHLTQQQPHQHQHYTYHHHQLQLQQLQHQHQNINHHQKYFQYQQQQQQQQLRLQDFTIGNKSASVGSSTSGQTKGGEPNEID